MTAPRYAGLGPLRLLLIEDDLGDARLVTELVADTGLGIEVTVVGTLQAAEELALDAFECALLDLHLPDGIGIASLLRLQHDASDLAIIVLTGQFEQTLGLQAVALGAQDFLNKNELDVHLLQRAIGYAVERQRSDRNERALLISEQRRIENQRVAKGLLPQLRIRTDRVSWATHYEPGGNDAMLGGDFFDAVELDDGTIFVLIGDVCGHGSDEAATGVSLRVSWRSLVMVGLDPQAVLAHLSQMLREESVERTTFATVCMARIDSDLRGVEVWVAGHPPPLLVTHDVRALTPKPVGPPLGVGKSAAVPSEKVALPDGWRLVFVTDGIFEGTATHRRDGYDGFVRRAAQIDRAMSLEDLLRRLVTDGRGDAAALNDDIALLALESGGP